MARTVKDSQFDTRTARGHLAPRAKPDCQRHVVQLLKRAPMRRRGLSQAGDGGDEAGAKVVALGDHHHA